MEQTSESTKKTDQIYNYLEISRIGRKENKLSKCEIKAWGELRPTVQKVQGEFQKGSIKVTKKKIRKKTKNM